MRVTYATSVHAMLFFSDFVAPQAIILLAQIKRLALFKMKRNCV